MGNFLSTLWGTLFLHPFLNIVLVLYAIFGGSLGLAVIAVAVISRILLIPSTKRQTEMTSKMSDLKPRLEKLQKKYKNNQEMLAKEQMKLYREVGYNPIGCLGSFLPQLLILAAIIGVITAITEGNLDGIYPFVQDIFFDGDLPEMLNTKFLFWDLAKTVTEVAGNGSYVSLATLPYIVLAILVGIVQYFATKFIQIIQKNKNPVSKKKKNKKKGKDEPFSPEDMQAQMTNSMTSIFPIMTAFFTLTAPAVLGLYWLVQSAMLLVQYFIIDKEQSMKVLRELPILKFLNKDN